MDKFLLDYICLNILQTSIKSYTSLSGGDISQVYLLEGKSQKYLLKVHKGARAEKMFRAEKEGLKSIAKTNTIRTPEVYSLDKHEGDSLLLMEFITTKNPAQKDYENLGTQLALLHQHTTSEFGFKEANFIGSLPQSNEKHKDWTLFYIQERLLPQLNLAKTKSLLSDKEVPSFDRLYKLCSHLFPDVKPSLLHGDLWAGNYLIASDGSPYLIDPAVYYGHSEVDLAMSRLFGGFSEDFYSGYHSIIPELSGHQERNKLYQLYYLLVHLNLFGRSYYSAVKRILDYFF